MVLDWIFHMMVILFWSRWILDKFLLDIHKIRFFTISNVSFIFIPIYRFLGLILMWNCFFIIACKFKESLLVWNREFKIITFFDTRRIKSIWRRTQTLKVDLSFREPWKLVFRSNTIRGIVLLLWIWNFELATGELWQIVISWSSWIEILTHRYLRSMGGRARPNYRWI